MSEPHSPFEGFQLHQQHSLPPSKSVGQLGLSKKQKTPSSFRNLSFAKVSASLSSFMSRISLARLSSSGSGGWSLSGSPTSPSSSPRKIGRNSSKSAHGEAKDIFYGQVEGKVEDKYVLGEEIGRGAFGICCKAEVSHRSGSGAPC